MAKKTRTGLGRNLLKLVLFVPAILSMTTRILTAARLEITAVRRKIICFFLLGLSCLVLLITVWSGLCGLLFLYLLSLSLAPLQAMVFVLLLNIFLLIIACLCLALFRVDLSFPKTRKDIQKLISD